jgi:hypothetical protein
MYCILSTHQGAHTECKQPALCPSSASLPGLQASSLTASKLLTGAAEKAARSHCFSLQVADRLFSSFGQDILDALYWTATEPKERKRAHIGVIPHFFMAVLYVCILLGLEGTPATRAALFAHPCTEWGVRMEGALIFHHSGNQGNQLQTYFHVHF